MVVVINYFAARNKNHLAQYPQIRVNQWNSGLITLSALSWITYLAGYEFMFRGFLLFSCLESFGLLAGHYYQYFAYIAWFTCQKDKGKPLDQSFFGFILSYLSLRLGSFWFAFLVHITLALSSEWFSIAFHPEMNPGKKTSAG